MQVKSIAEWEHSAIISTFIKLQFVIKLFVLSIFWAAILHRFYCIYAESELTKVITKSTILLQAHLLPSHIINRHF